MISRRWRLASALSSSLAWSAATCIALTSIFILAYLREIVYIVNSGPKNSTRTMPRLILEGVMAEVVVLGAGLSGTILAYELVPQLRRDDRLTVVGQGRRYHFVPSNPWVAIGWRERTDVEVDLQDVMQRK